MRLNHHKSNFCSAYNKLKYELDKMFLQKSNEEHEEQVEEPIKSIVPDEPKEERCKYCSEILPEGYYAGGVMVNGQWKMEHFCNEDCKIYYQMGAEG